MIPRNSTGWGYNRIKVLFNDTPACFTFDTGSYGSFTGNPALLEKLMAGTTPPKEIDAEEDPEKRRFMIDKLTLGSIDLENAVLTIFRTSVKMLDNRTQVYTITIDWKTIFCIWILLKFEPWLCIITTRYGVFITAYKESRILCCKNSACGTLKAYFSI